MAVQVADTYWAADDFDVECEMESRIKSTIHFWCFVEMGSLLMNVELHAIAGGE
jgi:hypothetical protein